MQVALAPKFQRLPETKAATFRLAARWVRSIKMTKTCIFLKVRKRFSGCHLSFLNLHSSIFPCISFRTRRGGYRDLPLYDHTGGTFKEMSFTSISLHVAVTSVPLREGFNGCTIHLPSLHSVRCRLPRE